LLAAIAIHCSNVVGFFTIVIIWQHRVGGEMGSGSKSAHRVRAKRCVGNICLDWPDCPAQPAAFH
jgi:hypothetical protein